MLKKLFLILFLLSFIVCFPAKVYATNIADLRAVIASLVSIFNYNSTVADYGKTTLSDWPQLQHDSQHSGRSTLSVAPNYQVKWAFIDKDHIVKNFKSEIKQDGSGTKLTDGFGSNFKFTVIFAGQMQPIIAAGKAYFGAMNGKMYAVDALNGDNKWDFTSDGPILSTAAYASGVLVFTSMDGKIYALDANTGSLKWSYQTGTSINAAPVIDNGIVYVGSRNGKFYAIDLASGPINNLPKLSFTTTDPNPIFAGAPIVAPAAVSEDHSTVMFGAENMNFYALNTANGSLKWGPKKLVGQSFLYSWPVVKGDKVVIRTMSSLPGAEGVMEEVLDGVVCTTPTCVQEEKQPILTWLANNPSQKTMYVFNIADGGEPYQVAMGRVTGNNYTPHLPVVDQSGRLLTYWRSKHATLFNDQGMFGSKYCPDISELDLATGDRKPLNNPSSTKRSCPELDNGFQPTIGGDYIYMHNYFRGSMAIKLTDGSPMGIAAPIACWDGSGFRSFPNAGGWGYQIIYYGNDEYSSNCAIHSPDPRPAKIYENPIGFAGITVASPNGQTNMLFINEIHAGAIVAIEHIP